MNSNLTIEDLERISGLPLRTLRFYMQEGILPGPDTHGKNARYSQQHVDRLELIQRLKNLRLPLQEIKELLAKMTPEELEHIQKGQVLDSMQRSQFRAQTATSALEYIKQLERGRENVKAISNMEAASLPMPMSPPLYKSAHLMMEASRETTGPETWLRIVIADGIELNIRQPANSDHQEKIDDLIEFARKQFSSSNRKGMTK